MPGAPVLAASAGLRLGAGWVSLADAGEPSFIPELLRVCRGEGGRGAFGRGDIPAVVSVVKRADGVVVGPGIGTAEETGDFLKAILAAASAAEIPTVIDADGLTLVGERIETTNIIAGKPVVLTPHPGEAARLLGVTSSEVQSDRFHAAREMANRFGCTVVLKGAGTVVYGEGRGFVCPFGTPYLAAPGSGDVLAGFIGALLAQGYPPLEAACRGTVIHARAGEMAHRQRGGYLIASDIFHAVGTTVRFV
jgi:NAD(P)H-hydrate epimerase